MRSRINLALQISVLAMMFFASSVYAEVRMLSTRSICDSLSAITAEDWVVLDLDGTVVSNDHIFAAGNGLSNGLQRLLQKTGAGMHPSWVISHPLSALKSISKGFLIEECLPERLQQLQAQGTWIFVITSRSSYFSASTLENLTKLGLSFPTPEVMAALLGPSQLNGFSPTVRFRNGVFLTGGASKGKVLKRLIDLAPAKPKFVAAFDDLDKNVKAYERALLEAGIPSDVYRYLSESKSLTAAAWDLAEETWLGNCGSSLAGGDRKPSK